jgi:hypothetical protein
MIVKIKEQIIINLICLEFIIEKKLNYRNVFMMKN